MANEEQLAILRQGVEAWNTWRAENADASIDLSEADLIKANLRRADLDGANLWKADLGGADLRKAILRQADLGEANLIGANLTETDLRGTLLTGANLTLAELLRTEISQSEFSYVTFRYTVFGSLDLRAALGLESVHHVGPSIIGTDTIVKSRGRIPETFLRGCGLSDWEIESAKLYNPDLSNEEVNKILYRMYDLRATQALQISPLFISYSHGDSTFVDKLESQLNKKGIRFWRDVHDLKSGRLEKQIDRAMHFNPTVLLILSERSLQSDWVEHEVRAARSLEKEIGRDVLCPVALDDFWKESSWPKRVMEQVMEYNILDFSNWEDDNEFGGTFNKLIDGLELFYKG